MGKKSLIHHIMDAQKGDSRLPGALNLGVHERLPPRPAVGTFAASESSISTNPKPTGSLQQGFGFFGVGLWSKTWGLLE